MRIFVTKNLSQERATTVINKPIFNLLICAQLNCCLSPHQHQIRHSYTCKYCPKPEKNLQPFNSLMLMKSSDLTGHDFRSSQFGDACVPFGWQPCSGEPGCDHSNEQPMVNPLFVSTDCQTNDGMFVPCRSGPGGGSGGQIPAGGMQPEGI